MDKKSVLDIIARLQARIENKGIRISMLVLFGSFARGNFTESSDIDIVVVSDDFAGKGYWERIDILSDAIYEVFAPVEAVAMTSEEWKRGDTFISDYAKDGEIVYKAA
jgi:predicted nucleotidyltransferase